MSKEINKRKHNFYSTEFKQSAVQLVYDSGNSIAAFIPPA
ncbi:transposase [Flavobacteriaceae bacterium]|nr:transposase [Flavobacteriaceae bacterium]